MKTKLKIKIGSVLFFITIITLSGCARTSNKEIDIQVVLENALGISLDDLRVLDSIRYDTDSLYLLTITYKGCDICNDLFENDKYKQLSTKKIRIDVKESPTSMLISQALYTSGFPTSYFITKKLDISTSFSGIKDFVNQIDSVVANNYRYYDFKIPMVDDDAIPEMVSYSLKALHALKERNYKEAKELLLASYNKDAYFFNSFMLANMYMAEERLDSAKHYKAASLRHAKYGATPHIYENLISKLKLIK